MLFVLNVHMTWGVFLHHPPACLFSGTTR